MKEYTAYENVMKLNDNSCKVICPAGRAGGGFTAVREVVKKEQVPAETHRFNFKHKAGISKIIFKCTFAYFKRLN